MNYETEHSIWYQKVKKTVDMILIVTDQESKHLSWFSHFGKT